MCFISTTQLLIFSIGFLCCFGQTHGQEKFEREYKIDVSEVPINAVDFISICYFEKKVKWYAEESQLGKTFEAKTCSEKSKFSIEFDESGELLDVEEKVKFKQLPLATQQKMSIQLKTLFKSFKIQKIQKQWLGDNLAIINFLNDRIVMDQLVLNYEIVLMGKKEDSYSLYEVLFTNNFMDADLRKVKRKETDNLEF